MKFIKKIVEITFKKNTQEDWDSVWAIVGDEGKGKSNLSLCILDYWNVLKYGECKEEQIKNVTLNAKNFLKRLSDENIKTECIDYDEAGEISNRRMLSTFNFQITQAYQIIRGENMFTLLNVPSIFDIDPFFSKRRIRGLFYVYSRGNYAFWSKNRLRKLLAYNQNRYVKSMWLVKPSHIGHFPKYTGILLQPYINLKNESMKIKRQSLLELNEEKIDARCKMLRNMREKGLSDKEIGDLVGLSRNRVCELRNNKDILSESSNN